MTGDSKTAVQLDRTNRHCLEAEARPEPPKHVSGFVNDHSREARQYMPVNWYAALPFRRLLQFYPKPLAKATCSRPGSEQTGPRGEEMLIAGEVRAKQGRLAACSWSSDPEKLAISVQIPYTANSWTG
jgi:hypothetical protein